MSDGDRVGEALQDWGARYGGRSTEDWLEMLQSPNSQDRSLAVLALRRSEHPLAREAVREMVESETETSVLMVSSSITVGWLGAKTVMKLLRKNGLHHYALVAILMAMKYQKCDLDGFDFGPIARHPSPFVRLAFLDYAAKVKLPLVDYLEIISGIKDDLKGLDFIEHKNSPSPLFTDKTKFLRHLSRVKGRLIRDLALANG